MAIHVQVDWVGTQLHVEVTDQGMGISDEDQDRLFSPFERGTNPDVHRIPGTGLGLVIARSRVFAWVISPWSPAWVPGQRPGSISKVYRMDRQRRTRRGSQPAARTR